MQENHLIFNNHIDSSKYDFDQQNHNVIIIRRSSTLIDYQKLYLRCAKFEAYSQQTNKQIEAQSLEFRRGPFFPSYFGVVDIGSLRGRCFFHFFLRKAKAQGGNSEPELFISLAMFRKNGISSSVYKVIASPLLPALPDRPIIENKL